MKITDGNDIVVVCSECGDNLVLETLKGGGKYDRYIILSVSVCDRCINKIEEHAFWRGRNER